MIRNVIEWPDHALEQKCEREGDFEIETVRPLLIDLFETMQAKGGIGLAAPQVGDLRRVFVMCPAGVNFACINPSIHDCSDQRESMAEGCLSIPGFRDNVVRPAWIDVSYTDGAGIMVLGRLRGIEARCFQHELDHLDGKMFIDRLKGAKDRVRAHLRNSRR